MQARLESERKAGQATQTAEANLLAECVARPRDQVSFLCSVHAAVLNRCKNGR